MPDSRSVIVVLGPGRSGTSLLMQALAALGMCLSPRMVQTRQDNPQGFYEDAEIVRIHADLLRALGAWPYHPLPADWLTRAETAAARAALRRVLDERLAARGAPTPDAWGFKDPRTAAFLPLWRGLFAERAIAPRYLLALREPGSVLRSFMAAYATPPDIAEQVWLRRTADALRHTDAHCHIVQYEDWFTRGDDMARDLARYTGLGPATALAGLVRADLNRSTGPGHVWRDPRARALHEVLRNCRGDGFDRAEVLAAAGGAGCAAR